MKLAEMKSAEQVLSAQLGDPDFKEQWDRSALAREIANRVVAYRAQQGISQTALARRLAVSQPAVARLESGEHEPTLATLARLARCLGIEFHIEITPHASRLSA